MNLGSAIEANVWKHLEIARYEAVFSPQLKYWFQMIQTRKHLGQNLHRQIDERLKTLKARRFIG